MCNKLKTIQNTVSSLVGPWANGAEIEVSIRPRNLEPQSPTATQPNPSVDCKVSNRESALTNESTSLNQGQLFVLFLSSLLIVLVVRKYKMLRGDQIQTINCLENEKNRRGK
jgi:hypothetical protein